MIVMSALLAAGSASAVTVRGSCRASYYPVLTTDLLQSAVSSTIDKLTLNTAENNANSHGTLATLTDGTFGGVGANGRLCIAGGSLTYILDTKTSKTGYTILAINSYAGWSNSGRSAQNYTVTLNGDWLASGQPVKYPIENLYRMTVTMAATEGQENGGFVMAAGPWSNNDWPPGTVDLMKAMGTLMKRN